MSANLVSDTSGPERVTLDLVSTTGRSRLILSDMIQYTRARLAVALRHWSFAKLLCSDHGIPLLPRDVPSSLHPLAAEEAHAALRAAPAELRGRREAAETVHCERVRAQRCAVDGRWDVPLRAQRTCKWANLTLSS